MTSKPGHGWNGRVGLTAIVIGLSICAADSQQVSAAAGAKTTDSAAKGSTSASSPFVSVGAFRWASVVFSRYVPGTRDSVLAQLTQLGFKSNAGVWEIVEPSGTTQVSYPSSSQRTVVIVYRPVDREELPPQVLALIATEARQTKIGVSAADVISFDLDQHGLTTAGTPARSQVTDEIVVGMRDGAWIQTTRTISQLTRSTEPDTTATPLVK